MLFCDVLAASGTQNATQIHLTFYIILVIFSAVLSPRTILNTSMVFVSILRYFTATGLVTGSYTFDCLAVTVQMQILPLQFLQESLVEYTNIYKEKLRASCLVT